MNLWLKKYGAEVGLTGDIHNLVVTDTAGAADGGLDAGGDASGSDDDADGNDDDDLHAAEIDS